MANTIAQILIVSFLFLLFSCSEKKQEDISIESMADETILQYENVDFSQYYNLMMFVRERGLLSDAIYFETVTYGKNSIDPRGNWGGVLRKYGIFGVIYDSEKVSVHREYISNDSLKIIVNNFANLNLEYLKVDKHKNVFLSPFPLSFERAFMLRINEFITVKEKEHIRIEGDGTFSHYKGNWYLSNFYIDKYGIKVDGK